VAKLKRRRACVAHREEQPTVAALDSYGTDLNHGFHDVRARGDIDGHALGGRLGPVAVQRDLSFVFRREGYPVVVEVTAIQEERSDSRPAHARGAIQGDRRIFNPESHHVINIAAVGKSAVKVSQKLVQRCDLRVFLGVEDLAGIRPAWA